MLNDKYDKGLLRAIASKMGYKFYYFQKADSTMKIVQEFAKEREKIKIIALTDHQTSGVGRSSRKWQDRANSSLMFSILFCINESSIATFADLAALMICEAVCQFIGKPLTKIKYPNDLVADDKKLGGILAVNIYDEKLHYLGTNLGVGINVHYTSESLDKFQTDYPATSLDIVSGSFVNRQSLLIKILNAIAYLDTETKILVVNPKTRELFLDKWKEFSSIMGREIVILKRDKILHRGLVVDTEIGKGIELQNLKGRKWFSLFNTEMKARVLN